MSTFVADKISFRRLGACLFALFACLVAANAQDPLLASPATTHSLYLPVAAQPWTLYHPLAGSSGASSRPWPASQAALMAASRLGTSYSASYVQRLGENLVLDGKAYSFVGVNAYYLAGPFFPEEYMAEVISTLAARGVQVIRVFTVPWCDLGRVERMLDLGGQQHIRFILTLQDFYGKTDGWWFKEEYKTKGLPHIRRIVPLLAGRPEILMWELMNEPLCPAEDADKSCWEALYRWAQATSAEVRRLDPSHLVSAGTLRAGFGQMAIDTYRRVQSLDTIDVVSVHGQGGKLTQGERELERTIAQELEKPFYFGEVHIAGHDKQCQPLPGGALPLRADAIASDLEVIAGLGIDGYLLWQYAFGEVDMGTHVQHYCGELEYFADDPVWQVLLNGRLSP